MKSLKFVRALLLFAALAVGGGASAAEQFQVVNLTGVQSYDYEGEPGNTVIELNLGALSQITSIAWNFGMTAYSPSWLADMKISFTNSSGGGVYFTPSDTEDSGSEHHSGSASLPALGLAFYVESDGILRLEFSETYKDLGTGVADGQYDSGTITVGYVSAVPEPSTYAMMLLGLLAVGAVARRRQNS